MKERIDYIRGKYFFEYSLRIVTEKVSHLSNNPKLPIQSTTISGMKMKNLSRDHRFVVSLNLIEIVKRTESGVR